MNPGEAGFAAEEDGKPEEAEGEEEVEVAGTKAAPW